MKRIFAIACLAGATLLAACSTTGQHEASPADAVFQARTMYVAAVLEPAAAYAQLPACPQPAGVVCHDPKVVEQLQQADHVAETALDAAEKFVREHPTLDASSALDAAQAAIGAAQKIALSFGVK